MFYLDGINVIVYNHSCSCSTQIFRFFMLNLKTDDANQFNRWACTVSSWHFFFSVCYFNVSLQCQNSIDIGFFAFVKRWHYSLWILSRKIMGLICTHHRVCLVNWEKKKQQKISNGVMTENVDSTYEFRNRWKKKERFELIIIIIYTA